MNPHLLFILSAPFVIVLLAGCGKSKAMVQASAPAKHVAVAMEQVEIATFHWEELPGLLPASVVTTIQHLKEMEQESYGRDTEMDEPLFDDSVMVFNVVRPGESTLQMFISKMPRRSTVAESFALYLHDPKTELVTESPLQVSGRWLGVKGLLPRLTDLDLDGVPEIVYRDFHHNGTADNIEQLVCLSMGPALELTEVLRLNITEADMYSENGWGVIRRRLVRSLHASHDRLVVESWRENPRYGPSRESLESIELQQDAETGLWQNVSPLEAR